MDITEIKDALKNKKVVEYNSAKYMVTAYFLRYDEREKKFRHQLELKDLKANSLLSAELSKVCSSNT